MMHSVQTSLGPRLGAASASRLAARLVTLLLVFLWAAVVWDALRPIEIASDWNGWRQTDTQTIADNFLAPGASLLKPQIRWGGDGPGYVETELQLYTLAASLLMRVGGPGPWAGQLVSLLAVLGAAAVLFQHLASRYHPWAALAGVMAFIGVRTLAHLGSVVMPDALALFLYTAAWTAFYRYFEHARSRDLALYVLAGTLAMLTKPTAGTLGLASFLLLALGKRRLLADRRTWLAWGGMLLVFGLYLAHAHKIYDDYGNTFGLLFGEDSKRPKLRHLLMPRLHLSTLMNAIRWGLGPLGVIALAAVVALRRRLDPEFIALGVANGLLALLAFRYMSQDAGNYYFAPMTVLAGGAVAALADELLGRASVWLRRLGLAALVVGLGFQVVRGFQIRHMHANFVDPEVAAVVAVGREIDRLAGPEELIVARSPNEAFDVFWDTGRNYHDPRIFYLSETRGWTLGREQGHLDLLELAAARGARFFADPLAQPHPTLEGWLRGHGELVWDGGASGRIWRFKPKTSPVAAP